MNISKVEYGQSRYCCSIDNVDKIICSARRINFSMQRWFCNSKWKGRFFRENEAHTYLYDCLRTIISRILVSPSPTSQTPPVNWKITCWTWKMHATVSSGTNWSHKMCFQTASCPNRLFPGLHLSQIMMDCIISGIHRISTAHQYFFWIFGISNELWGIKNVNKTYNNLGLHNIVWLQKQLKYWNL